MELNYKNTRAVTFDGPGSLDMMNLYSKNFVQGHGATRFKPKELDIKRYTAGPNLINTCNRHVGVTYRLFP